MFTRSLCRRMSVFTQNINRLTGKSEWVVHDENYDYHQEIARSAFADMLHDTERNQKYYRALQSAVALLHSQNKKANVLDIGTGTGLLSMMAVQCGADTVTACEAFGPVADCALKIIRANGFADKIRVVPKNSLDLEVGSDLEQRANILVTEVFDTELIGEGAIKTFSHALKHLLTSDCIVIPNSATIYAQVVECPLISSFQKFKPVHDPDSCEALIDIPTEITHCHGSPALFDIQLSQLPIEQFHTIIGPVPVLHFDFSGKKPLVYSQTTAHSAPAKISGHAHAVFVWWDLKMDPQDQITLSCAPFWAHPDIASLKTFPSIKDSIPWRDHWMQSVYFFPNELQVTKSKPITLITNHDEFSLWFNITNDAVTKIVNEKPACSCGLHNSVSRTRIGQINNSKRIKKYISALSNLVSDNTVCLSLSDCSFLGLIAARLGARKVYNLETSRTTRRALEKLAEYNKLEDRIVFIDNLKDLKNNINNSNGVDNINLIIGEPNFMYSSVPWDNFHFMYLLRNDLKDMLDKHKYKVLPVRASLMAMCVNFLHLHKIKASLGTCEGFKMEHFDHLIKNSSNRADDKIEPQPLWEYTGYAMTEPIALKTFDVLLSDETSSTNTHKTVTDIQFPRAGKLNGIAFWVDWHLDETSRNIVSTGPTVTPVIGEEIKWDMFTRQGVFLLEETTNVTEDTRLSITITCSTNLDNIDFDLHLD